MATKKELKALKILSECKCDLGITPKEFGVLYFSGTEYEYLLTSVSNIGNGATAGVKAWRLAGCILGRLRKKGYVKYLWGHYKITDDGIKELKEQWQRLEN